MTPPLTPRGALAGRELDALIAEKVMGDALISRKYLANYDEQKLPHYSTDIAAALSVVEKLREHRRQIRAELTQRGFIAFTYQYATPEDPQGEAYIDGWTCHFRDCKAPWGAVERGAPTLPYAICLAALAALANPEPAPISLLPGEET